MTYIIKEIDRVNTAESSCGDILMIENNIIIPYSNVVITGNGLDKIFNDNVNSYLDFCFIIFENIEVVTFDYDFSRLIDREKRKCYGGVHYLRNEEFEFWISCKSAKVILNEGYVFSKMPFPIPIEKRKILLNENPAYRDLIKL